MNWNYQSMNFGEVWSVHVLMRGTNCQRLSMRCELIGNFSVFLPRLLLQHIQNSLLSHVASSRKFKKSARSFQLNFLQRLYNLVINAKQSTIITGVIHRKGEYLVFYQLRKFLAVLKSGGLKLSEHSEWEISSTLSFCRDFQFRWKMKKFFVGTINIILDYKILFTREGDITNFSVVKKSKWNPCIGLRALPGSNFFGNTPLFFRYSGLNH